MQINLTGTFLMKLNYSEISIEAIGSRLTVKEASVVIGKSINTVLRYIATGKLKAFKSYKVTFISLGEINKLANNNN
jgi:hypothetical protein